MDITAATTLGEIADLVGEPVVVETVPRGAPDAAAIDEDARSRRIPYLATAATAAAGYTAWGAAELAAAVGPPNAHGAVVAGTCVATAAALPALRIAFRHGIPDMWRRRWWLAGAAAAAWVDVAAATTPATWLMTTALLLGSAALSAGWLAEHEVPNPSQQVITLPPPHPLPAIDTSRAAQLEQAWAARVSAGRNSAAPGSRLTGREELPTGTRWTVELDPEGGVGCTDLLSRAPRIALALGVKPSHVILERLEDDDDSEDRGQVTVVTRDSLAGGVPYQGPRYHEGRIPIGLYADGTGEAEWVAYDNTGVRCGLVAGGQGSGKSALMAALAMAYKASGEWIVLFGDGDDQGNSSRLMQQVAHDSAKGAKEILEQLEGLESWYRIRGLFMPTLTTGPDGKPTPLTDPATQHPVAQILPCPAYPGHVWFLDELHRLVANPTLKAAAFIPRVAKLVRILRKYGGSIIVGTQSLLGDDFGGDTAFRGMLAQGNLIALRNKNKSERHIVSDFGFAPSTLPKGGGYAFSDDGVRRAMLRVAHSEDMHLWAATLPNIRPDRRSAQAYARKRSPRELDPAADFQTRQRELAAFDLAIAHGRPLPGEPTVEEAAEAAADATAVSVGGKSVPAPLGAKVIPMRPRSEAAPPAEPAGLSPKAAQVLVALCSRPGQWRSAELVEETKLTGPDVSKALGVLVERGLAHRPTGVQGVHAAGPAPAQPEEGTP